MHLKGTVELLVLVMSMGMLVKGRRLEDLGIEQDLLMYDDVGEGRVEHLSCDCDYHPGGCTISDKAPPGLACKCVYKGFWTCGGEVTHCADENNYYCKHPDRSYESCKQGEGDCGGILNY